MKSKILFMIFIFAHQNFLLAQDISGRQKIEHLGIKKELQEALKLSNEGDADAQFELGVRYILGLEVDENHKVAADYLLKASKQNHKIAQYNLGTLYFSPQIRDTDQAVKWIKTSAENGFPDAQNFLAGLYIRGRYIPKDALKAIKWYRLAAKNSHIGSLNSLGLIYLNGSGVDKNILEASRLFKEAAFMGHEAAQKNLAKLYILGVGVKQDYVKAYAWLTLSSQQGFSPAEKIRNDLISSMSSSEIEEGLYLAEKIIKTTVVN